jgi:hypothetical protein
VLSEQPNRTPLRLAFNNTPFYNIGTNSVYQEREWLGDGIQFVYTRVCNIITQAKYDK